MTIFIIFSSQKTRGRVAGNLARLHATQLRDRCVANGIAHCILLRTFIYALLVIYLGAAAQRKKALNYVENVNNMNKDQNCDWLNFIFVQFSLENEDVYYIWHCIKMFISYL